MIAVDINVLVYVTVRTRLGTRPLLGELRSWPGRGKGAVGHPVAVPA